MALKHQELLCSFCCAPTKFACSRCYEPYCDLKCQVLDRINHLLVCKPVPPLIKFNTISNDDGILKLVAHDSTNAAIKISTPNDAVRNKSTVLSDVENLVSISQQKFLSAKDSKKSQAASEIKTSSSSIKRIQDLPVIKLHTGENVPLIVTNTSMLEKCTIFAVNSGYELSKNLLKIEKYSQTTERELMSYKPKVNELCLAIFHDDGHWYRACHLKGYPKGNCLVNFVDFGTNATIWLGNLMPIPDELMFPIYTNRCRITNIQNDDLKKLFQYFKTKRSILADIRYNKKHKLYDVAIKNLEKILA